MTQDQYNQKMLLDYEAELEGMKSENRLREIQGKSPAYGENAFATLNCRYTELLNRY